MQVIWHLQPGEGTEEAERGGTEREHRQRQRHELPLPRLAGSFLVPARLHHATEPGVRSAAIRGDIDDVLHLRMIEQETVDGTVVIAGEVLAKTLTVQSTRARLAPKDAAHEAHFRILREQIDRFVVQALIDEISVRVLQSSDCVHVLEHADALHQCLDLFLQRLDPFPRHRFISD